MNYLNSLLYFNVAVLAILNFTNPVMGMDENLDDAKTKTSNITSRNDDRKKENLNPSSHSETNRLFVSESNSTIATPKAFFKPTAFNGCKSPTNSSSKIVHPDDESMTPFKGFLKPIIPFDMSFEWKANGLKTYTLTKEMIEATDETFFEQTPYPERLLGIAENYSILAFALENPEAIRNLKSHEMSELASSDIATFLLEMREIELAKDFKEENEKRHAVRRNILSSNTPVKEPLNLISRDLTVKFILKKRLEILSKLDKENNNRLDNKKSKSSVNIFSRFW